MRRWGWTDETIREGQYLRLVGRPSRDGGPMMLLEGSTLRDGGAILELEAEQGAIVRTVVGTNALDRPVADALSLTLEDGRPNLSGTWLGNAPGSAGRTPPPLNAVGRTLAAAFDPAEDPGFTECQDPGLVRTVVTIHSVEIEQYENRVVLSYEAGVHGRVVYLDGRGPESGQHTPLGHSVARYEGDALVIETSQLLERLPGGGNPVLSDQTTTVETYRRADNPASGPLLEMTIIIADPVYLEEPWEMTWQKPYSINEYQFTGVDCRLPLR